MLRSAVSHVALVPALASVGELFAEFIEVFPLCRLTGDLHLRQLLGLRADWTILIKLHGTVTILVCRVRLRGIGHVLTILEWLVLHIIREATLSLRLLR